MNQASDISVYRRYIEDALQYAGGSHSYEDVVAAVAENRMQLWPGPNSVIVTEIHDVPRYRAINFFLAGGERNSLAELEKMVPVILDWARAQGCTKALFTGRPGWERTFVTRMGWKRPAVETVVLEKSLDGQE